MPLETTLPHGYLNRANGLYQLVDGVPTRIDTDGASDGDALLYDAATGLWLPGTVSGGTGATWTPRGPWSSSTAYVADDVVTSGGSSWLALGASTNVTPVEGASWTLIAQKGDTGATGASGASGAAGAAGRGFTPRGAWATATAYAVDDIVTSGGSTYRVATAHTSSGAIDLTKVELWAQKGDTGATGPAGTSGSSGTPLYTAWDPFDPFASPSALDDEFTASTLDAKWAAVGTQTLTVDLTTRDQLGLVGSAPAVGAGFNAGAVEQVLPSGNFQVFAYMEHLSLVQYSFCGLYVRNASTNIRFDIGLYLLGNAMANHYLFSFNYNAFNSRTSATYEQPWGRQDAWLCLTGDGTTIRAWATHTGRGWVNVNSVTVASLFSGGAPNRTGLSADAYNGSIAAKAAWRFLRYVPSYSTGALPQLGRARTVYG